MYKRQIWYRDSDADLYGNNAIMLTQCDQPSGYVLDNTDCADGDADRNPGHAEICDSKDNDCDDLIDDADATLNTATASTWYADTDSDGYGTPSTTTLACAQPSAYVNNSSDCDDSNAALNPDTTWWRDVDNDGYGVTGNTTQSCTQPAGYVGNNTDCDDANASICLLYTSPSPRD